MFNKDFYPTPESVVYTMLQGVEVAGKTVLEPSAGKGDIINVLNDLGAKEVLSCEINSELAAIVKTKSNFLKSDFLQVTKEEVSHVGIIVMNPPFSADEKHILHAWELAPDGCDIVALCNSNTVSNKYSRVRRELSAIIENYGSVISLGDCFKDSERGTSVDVSLIRLRKPSTDYAREFNGFFTDDDEYQHQENGLMTYNAIRDIVNRYVEAVKTWDAASASIERLNGFTSGVFGELVIGFHRDETALTRESFKKEMQKRGWNWVISKMNLEKMVTSKVRERINNFVETQIQYPFTMRNIYHMIDMVIQTREENMNIAIEEIFDSVTKHHHENRYNLEGWKTNSHYLLTRKFIFPYLFEHNSYGWKYDKVNTAYNSNFDRVEDLVKALCFITGKDYDPTNSLRDFYNKEPKKEWGEWYEWGFFRVKAYKKGTGHFEFIDEDLWAMFNQRVAKIKGFPLPEKVNKTERKDSTTATQSKEAKVLFSIKLT